MSELFETAVTGDQFLTAMQDTLIMVALSLGFGSLLGLPLGIVLVICRPGGIQPNRLVHQLLNPIVNIIRSLPFIILLITILPLTRLLVNTTIGTAGAIVPLVIFIAPYIRGWWRMRCWRWMRAFWSQPMRWVPPRCRPSGIS